MIGALQGIYRIWGVFKCKVKQKLTCEPLKFLKNLTLGCYLCFELYRLQFVSCFVSVQGNIS